MAMKQYKRFLVTWTESACALATVQVQGLTDDEAKERVTSLVFDEIECEGYETVKQYESEMQGDVEVSTPPTGFEILQWLAHHK